MSEPSLLDSESDFSSGFFVAVAGATGFAGLLAGVADAAGGAVPSSRWI